MQLLRANHKKWEADNLEGQEAINDVILDFRKSKSSSVRLISEQLF